MPLTQKQERVIKQLDLIKRDATHKLSKPDLKSRFAAKIEGFKTDARKGDSHLSKVYDETREYMSGVDKHLDTTTVGEVKSHLHIMDLAVHGEGPDPDNFVCHSYPRIMPKTDVSSPLVRIHCSANSHYPDLPAAVASSNRESTAHQIKAGGNHSFKFPERGTRIKVESLSQHSQVTITNLTSIPLVVTTRRGRDDLEDVLKANGKFQVSHGTRATIT